MKTALYFSIAYKLPNLTVNICLYFFWICVTHVSIYQRSSLLYAVSLCSQVTGLLLNYCFLLK